MKKTLIFFVFIVIINSKVGFFASSAYPDDPPVPSGSQEAFQEPFIPDGLENSAPPSIDMKKSILKMVISLIIILLLFTGFAFFFKKFFSQDALQAKHKGLMRIVERLVLGPKQQLLLVWVIDRMLLLSLNSGRWEKVGEIKSETVTRELGEDIFPESLQRELANEKAEEVLNAQ